MRFREFVLFLIAFSVLSAPIRAQEHDEPIYVGARVCATCHQGPELGHQFSKWLLSRHSRAYAVLGTPDAEKIARLSGVPQQPQQAIMCLGCHATAAETEEWERDETFLIEDGVQCEKCHGAGSEYMDDMHQRDPEGAMKAGLRKIRKEDCLVCHYPKGSHVAIHRKPQLNIDEAWELIAHPRPQPPPKLDPTPPVAEPAGAEAPFQYVGVRVCAECHKGPEQDYQFSRWRISQHASAYARLATPRAYEMARSAGITSNPQEAGACLKCHSTTGKMPGRESLDSFSMDEGVGCEACHGPGSEYSVQAIMIDPVAAHKAGLKTIEESDCLRCHDNAHGKAFDTQAALQAIDHGPMAVEVAQREDYKNPVNLAISPDSRELWAACESSNSVIVIDLSSRTKVAEIPVGGQPNDVAFSTDGKKAYVSNRMDDTISEIDVAKRQVVRSAAVGDEPHGLLINPSGNSLYVLNTLEDSISVLDPGTLQERKRLSASRNPWSLSLSADGKHLLITNALSRPVGFREPSVSEVTVVDSERAVVTNRVELPGTNLLQGVAWHPSGEFALVTMNRTKNLVPMTRLLQGWTITNGLGIVWRDGRADQVLLDEPDRCFPDPTDVTFARNGELAFVTSSGSNSVAVVDTQKLITLLKNGTDEQRRKLYPNHLGFPGEFVVKRIPVGHSPRGILAAPDGRTVFVANTLDDSVTLIDAERLEVVSKVDLEGSRTVNKYRLGERAFHSANIAFKRQFSCHTCHPDGHVDGLTYDIEPDGVGTSPVDNRSLRGVLDTAPFKWEGTNPNLQRQCGPRLAVFFTRIEPFTPEELEAIEFYIATIPRSPNRHRPLGAELTPAQRRGKALFERRFTNDSREIPLSQRCHTCHPAPLYTNHTTVNVGTQMMYDVDGVFDVPHLTNIYDSAPYLHNGIAQTLEEIWTRFNAEDKHGYTNDMTKDQLNDLIEYLKTL